MHDEAWKMNRRTFGVRSLAAGGLGLMGLLGASPARGATVDRDGLRRALQQAVLKSHSPGASAYVGNLEEDWLHEAYGLRTLKPEQQPAERDTLYDLASLTKVVATTTSILQLWEQGKLDLDAPASEYFPYPHFKKFTLRHMMTHTTGLPWGSDFYKRVSNMLDYMDGISRLPLKSAAGTRWEYSDPGFVMLGEIVGKVSGMPLEQYARKHIFDPLQMNNTMFRPPAKLREACAATEFCEWQKRIIQGEVHDENTRAVGGVTGAAGLFSTTGDLAIFCRALLKGELVKSETLDKALKHNEVPCYPLQGLGWQLGGWDTSSRGFLPSRQALGHTGWTGTAIHMDRATGNIAILLGNTCHLSRKTWNNGYYRRTFYFGVRDALYSGKTNTHYGLDRLVKEGFSALRGKRFGLLTNHAAVDQYGTHILDLLPLGSGLQLKYLYSPEHGIRGNAEAGEKVAGQAGLVPVLSLYGEAKAPPVDQLKAIDTLVIDLQDIGVRYYTYMATMLDCMRACAENNVAVMVLDRPNPLGGEVVEGPVATQYGSHVCCAPIPVRHGMTMGELALFFKEQVLEAKKLEVEIVKLDSWEAKYLHHQCDLSWTAPSPNMPSAATALLYVGSCLVEGTNMNEGRGTDTPFHVFGAPWLDAEKVIASMKAQDMPGCRLEAVTYTPRSIPGKSTNPKFKDEACQGIRIHIRDAHQVRAFRMAIAMLGLIQERHGDQLKFVPFFDTLAGGSELRQALLAGTGAGPYLNTNALAMNLFDAQRPRIYERSRLLPR